MSANSSLINLAKLYIDQFENLLIKSEKKQKVFGEFNYGAESWKRQRRVFVKAEYNI